MAILWWDKHIPQGGLAGRVLLFLVTDPVIHALHLLSQKIILLQQEADKRGKVDLVWIKRNRNFSFSCLIDKTWAQEPTRVKLHTVIFCSSPHSIYQFWCFPSNSVTFYTIQHLLWLLSRAALGSTRQRSSQSNLYEFFIGKLSQPREDHYFIGVNGG